MGIEEPLSLEECVEIPSETQSKAWRRFVGLLIVVGVVCSWVLSAEVAQYDETKEHYDKTFFIVWCNNTWNIVILPIYALLYYGQYLAQFLSYKMRRRAEDAEHTHEEGECLSGGRKTREPPTLVPLWKYFKTALDNDEISWKKIIFAAFTSTVNLCCADYLYFRALSMTSAGSGIVIFNLSSIMVRSFFTLSWAQTNSTPVRVDLLHVHLSSQGTSVCSEDRVCSSCHGRSGDDCLW